MSFSYGQKIVDVLLERRSMAVLTGDARFKWKHSYVSLLELQFRGFWAILGAMSQH
jgi:alkylated DNA repair dioxygenase AlkB